MGVGWSMGWMLTWLLAAAAEPPRAKVVSVLEKVRPGRKVKGKAEARLSLARNECEGTQVVLPPGTSSVKVRPLVLKGPNGQRLETSVWREAYLDVRTPSNSQGDTGPWPDPLVPVRAPPTPGVPTVLYVELCAPESQAPGTYRGELRLVADGRELVPVPVTARVQPFILPATASLPTSFGISRYSIARGHGLEPDSPKARELLQAYARELLAHRLSAHGMGMDAPPVRFEKGRAVVDFRAYDAELAPFLEGTALPSGARFTTAELRNNPKARTDAEKAAYYRAFAEHFREKGWRAQLFFYARDEPTPEEMLLVQSQARRVHAAGMDVPVLVTSPLDEALRDSAGILVPPLNCFFPRPGPQTCRHVIPLPALRGKLGPGVKVWWYQSCNAHGCNGGPSEDAAVEKAYSGWASYMVDHPAPLNRAMGPLAFLTGVDGELYFDTIHAYVASKSPWEDVFVFGGNGDGTLFYPGTPARPGFSHHQPVVSLRLKHIRDGLEDHEYLRLLVELGEQDFARQAARQLTRSGYEVELNTRRWERIRREMTDRLRKRWEASEYSKRSGVRPK